MVAIGARAARWSGPVTTWRIPPRNPVPTSANTIGAQGGRVCGFVCERGEKREVEGGKRHPAEHLLIPDEA